MRPPPPLPVSALARWSRRLGAAAAGIALLAIAGAQLGRISASEALTGLGGSFAFATLALVLGAGALGVIWRHAYRGLGLALSGMLLALLVLAYPAYALALSLLTPPINDITTDVETPPAFLGDASPAAPLRPYQKLFAAEQRAAYPAVQPLVIDVGVNEAFDLAAEALKGLGLEQSSERSPGFDETGEGYIEAEEASLLLRLTDDVVIRLRPNGADETRIDIRSRSRIGRHDLGVNAGRVTRIIDEITRLAAAQE
jgi:hypothetical protein